MMVISITLLALFLRLYQLDMLPGEMWGDVIEHYKLVQTINKGEFFINYSFGGDGPLFSYLAAIFAKIFGLSFYSLKLTSIFINLLLIIVVYYYTKELFKKKEIAAISSFLTAVGFWSLSFSRQAKPYILVPLFVILSLYLLIRKKNFLAGLVLGVGMYTQSAFWGMCVFIFSSLATFFGFLISAGLFIYQFLFQKDFVLSSSSYLGEKFIGSFNLGVISYLKGLFVNIYKNLISFNFVGDASFRYTIPDQSHLDLVTGIFFLLGWFFLIKFILKIKDKKPFILFIISFFSIQIPSLLDVKNHLSTPSMARMIGVMPISYIIAAYGFHQTGAAIKKLVSPNFFFPVTCFIILIVNFHLYFNIYPQTLPNKNTPFGKIIASKMDQYPSIIKVVMLGCCWGNWGQPEPNGILFSFKKAKTFIHVEKIEKLPDVLKSIKNDKFIIIAAPDNDLSYLKPSKKNILEKDGWKIARLYEFF